MKILLGFLLVYSFPKQVSHKNESGFMDFRLVSMGGFFWLKCLCWLIRLCWLYSKLRNLCEKVMNILVHEELRLHYLFPSIGGGGRDRPILAVAVLEIALVCNHNCTTRIIFSFVF